MSKVLVINGTISNPKKSFSLGMVDKFLEIYKKSNPNDEIQIIDLNELRIANETLTRSDFESFWDKETIQQIELLKSVDKIIISSPMNNFGVTGLVKNYLDHILLANQTFSYKYSKKGDAIGLLTNLKVQIITTQGAPKGWYMWGDHTEFLKGTWEFVGAEVVQPILLAGVKTTPLNQMEYNDVLKTIEPEVIKAARTF